MDAITIYRLALIRQQEILESFLPDRKRWESGTSAAGVWQRLLSRLRASDHSTPSYRCVGEVQA